MSVQHLDTNVVIALINRDGNSSDASLQAIDRVRSHYRSAIGTREPLAVSAIVVHELYFGAFKSTRQRENLAKLDIFLASGISVLSFDNEDARTAGEIRTLLAAKGMPIGPYDVLIAGQALRHSATLVTANARELRRVPGLKVVDWTRK
jgi:tRNA(fMet)-specific endonuclease VapC